MLYWCIKNSIVMICFTILAIVFDAWWIALFGALFMNDYKETISKEDEHERNCSEIN